MLMKVHAIVGKLGKHTLGINLSGISASVISTNSANNDCSSSRTTITSNLSSFYNSLRPL